jgi:hypothetical protein
MKTILLILLAWLIASVLGFGMGWMFVRHGIAFTYLLCAVIGGGFLTYWSISDEQSQ